MSRLSCSILLLTAFSSLPLHADAVRPGAAVVLRHGAPVSALVFAPDGKTLVSAGWDHMLRRWDVATGRELLAFAGHDKEIECLAMSPNGKTIASGSWDRTIRLWDPASGKELRQVGTHPDGILCLAFSPDGKTLASGNQDQMARQGTLHLWKLADGKLLRTIVGHTSPVSAVAFAPDGKTVASGSLDQSIRLWETESGKELAILQGHEGWVQALAFSADGRLLGSSSADKTVRLWDLATNKQRYVFTGHQDKVRAIAFSRDGKTLVSGGFDRTLRFWESASGQERLKVSAHKGGIRSLAFSPDGRRVASGSSDGTVRVATVQALVLGADRQQEALTDKDLEARWNELAGKDAAAAFHAGIVLACVPKQAVPFLRDRLKLATGAEPKQVAQLIADLDSDQFAARQKALTELEKLGELARPALEKAVGESDSVEVRRRAQELLDKIKGPVRSTERLQVLRAVEVLENIGSTEAKQVLEKMAQGAAEAWLTQEAKAALTRLSPRKSGHGAD